MQAFAAQCMNVSECPESLLLLRPAQTVEYVTPFTSLSELEPLSASKPWTFQLTAAFLISIVWLSTQIQARRASKSQSALSESKSPPQVPYLVPVLGHVFSYLLNPFSLASVVRYVKLARAFLSSCLKVGTEQHAGKGLELLRLFASISSPKTFTW